MKKKPVALVPEETLPDTDFIIIDEDDFTDTFCNVRNPLELMMATKLFIHGYPFVYQKKINIKGTAQGRKFVIADFLLIDDIVDNTGKIIIEVDGKYHQEPEQQEKDRTKDNFLVSMGYRIFRFDWNLVMSDRDDWDVMDFIDG